MTGFPDTWIDGLFEKSGAWGSDSACKGDTNHCMYTWLEGTDSAACELSNNKGVVDRMSMSAPVALKITSEYDEATQSGTLTVKATLDAEMRAPNGTCNKISVLLYERNVESKYGKDKILYAQLAREELLFEDFTPTQPGESATFTAPFTLNSAWVADNVGAISFVQNYVGSCSDAAKSLMAYDIYNSGFLQNVNASAPPPSGHGRPVTAP